MPPLLVEVAPGNGLAFVLPPPLALVWPAAFELELLGPPYEVLGWPEAVEEFIYPVVFAVYYFVPRRLLFSSKERF